MKCFGIALGLVLAVAISLGGTSTPERRVVREATEWCDFWAPNSDNNNLPRVLLIGDSISRGYYPNVDNLLRGWAYCARMSTSKAVGDPALPAEIAAFVTGANYDVIHFNIGLHGWGYSEEEYRKYLPELLDAIRKNAPHAKLIWASSTPVRADGIGGATNARIAARNEIAKSFFAGKRIAIDDLNALMTGHADLQTDGVHYNPQGFEMLAKQVSDQIKSQLPPARK